VTGGQRNTAHIGGNARLEGWLEAVVRPANRWPSPFEIASHRLTGTIAASKAVEPQTLMVVDIAGGEQAQVRWDRAVFAAGAHRIRDLANTR
jgi:hypothetical protein